MNGLSVLILLCIRGNQITGSFRILYQHNTGGKPILYGSVLLRRTGGFVLVYIYRQWQKFTFITNEIILLFAIQFMCLYSDSLLIPLSQLNHFARLSINAGIDASDNINYIEKIK